MVDTYRAIWRKSSRSSPNNDNCVEMASIDQHVAVRDSKNPDGGRLAFRRRGLTAFARAAKRGGYDQ